MNKREDAIHIVDQYMYIKYGAVRIETTDMRLTEDEGEELLCGYTFPDSKGRKLAMGEGMKDAPEVMVLFIHNSQEVFQRIIDGEIRGIPYYEVQTLCELLQICYGIDE